MAIDIDQSHYNTGTATVVGTAVVGQGTTFTVLRKGDLYGTHRGAGVRIADIADDTHLTLAYDVPALYQTAAPYEVQRTPYDLGYLQAIEDIVELMGNGLLPALAPLDGTGGDKLIRLTGPQTADVIDGKRVVAIAESTGAGVIELAINGTVTLVPKTDLVSGVDYDEQVDDLPARSVYDPQLEGFSVLISNMGDGRAAITSRVTATAGVWSDPAYVTGPEGAPSTVPGVVWRDTYDPATTYAANDGVLYDGSSWRAKITTLGNAPPDLPIVENTQWKLLARHGLDGVVQVPGLQAQGRLTLTAGVATPTSDVVGATSVYYVPSGGVYVPIYNGAVFDALSIGSGLSLALDSNAGHPNYHAAANNYDLFVIDDGGTLRLVTGPAWVQGAVAGSAILRGTGAGSTELEVFLGYPVNKNAMTVRFGSAVGDTVVVAARKATYVGSFRATADGQATDSKAKRLLFNAFNATVRPMKISDPVASWTYNTAAYRQANANANMKLQLLLGLNGIAIEAEYSIVVNNPTANSYAILAIGLDSTTTPSADCYGGTTFLGIPTRDVATKYNGFPGLGFHEIIPLENSGATGTTTFYSTGNGYNVGLYGQFLG